MTKVDKFYSKSLCCIGGCFAPAGRSHLLCAGHFAVLCEADRAVMHSLTMKSRVTENEVARAEALAIQKVEME